MGSYIITAECIGCAECLTVCEDEAIEERGELYTINSACTDCAACESVCPVQCIVKLYNAK